MIKKACLLLALFASPSFALNPTPMRIASVNIPGAATVKVVAPLSSADVAAVLRMPKPMLPPPSLPPVGIAPGHDEEGDAGVLAILLPPKRPLTPAAAAAALPRRERLDELFDRRGPAKQRAPALSFAEAY